MQHKKVEADGTGPFGAEALRAKKAALMEGHAAAEKVRKENAVAANKTHSLTDLIAMLQKHGAIAASSKDDALGAGVEEFWL